MLLNNVITLTLSLILRNSDILMQLVLLTGDHLANCASHLLHQEDVQFRVESILVVLVETLNGSFLTEVLLDNSHDGLLHTLLENVILS